MFKEKLCKVVAGFLMAAVLSLPASGAFAEEIRPGVGWSLEALWQIWAGLVSAFGSAEGRPTNGGEMGPAIDPYGLTSEPREVGPRIDPYGLSSEPEGDVGPAIDPNGQR